MQPQEKLQSLRFLSETHRTEHHNRQRFEWKLLFTALTFYVLSVGGMYKYIRQLPATTAAWACGIFAALAGVCIFHLWIIHRANHVNKSFAEEAERAIRDILNGEDPYIDFAHERVEGKEFWGGAGGLWALVCQASLLVLFAFTAVMVVKLLN